MEINLVIFDLAGTTVEDHNYVNICLQNALTKKGIPVTQEELNGYKGYPKPFVIHQILGKKAKNFNNADFEEIYHAFTHEMVDFYSTGSEVKEKDHASQIFTTLHENNIKIAAETGFSRKIADAILARMNWGTKNLIDASVASDEVERGRPYPDMIFKAMDLTGIENVSEVMKVGDTLADLQQGYNAGCRFNIAVTSGTFTKGQLQEVPHSHLIDDLAQLLKILNIQE